MQFTLRYTWRCQPGVPRRIRRRLEDSPAERLFSQLLQVFARRSAVRAVSAEEGSSKINTDELLKTVADKVHNPPPGLEFKVTLDRAPKGSGAHLTLAPARDLGATSSSSSPCLVVGGGGYDLVCLAFNTHRCPGGALRARRIPSPGFLSPADAAAPHLRKWLSTGLFGWLQSTRWLIGCPALPFALSQWEDTENKSSLITYVAGGAAIVWLSGTVVGAINGLPIVSIQFPSPNPTSLSSNPHDPVDCPRSVNRVSWVVCVLGMCAPARTLEAASPPSLPASSWIAKEQI